MARLTEVGACVHEIFIRTTILAGKIRVQK
jgi:hypothetical protein